MMPALAHDSIDLAIEQQRFEIEMELHRLAAWRRTWRDFWTDAVVEGVPPVRMTLAQHNAYPGGRW